MVKWVQVTLHVSVWVEMQIFSPTAWMTASRSTWACELKWKIRKNWKWYDGSRSTWACELKFSPAILTVSSLHVTLHVSVWVEILCQMIYLKHELVTLHVSVWVEIKLWIFAQTNYRVTLHVSVWVEIKDVFARNARHPSHAPRERVSWNPLWSYSWQNS